MARRKKASSSSSFVVSSRVREHLKNSDMRMGSDLVPALDELIVFLIDEAAQRAAYNGRVTVSAGDL